MPSGSALAKWNREHSFAEQSDQVVYLYRGRFHLHSRPIAVDRDENPSIAVKPSQPSARAVYNRSMTDYQASRLANMQLRGGIGSPCDNLGGGNATEGALNMTAGEFRNLADSSRSVRTITHGSSGLSRKQQDLRHTRS